MSAFGFGKRCFRCGRRSSRLRRSRKRLTRDRWLSVYWRQRLSARSRQRLWAFGFGKRRFWCGRRSSRWCWLRCGRLRLAGDRRLAAYRRRRLSARSRQRLWALGLRKRRFRRGRRSSRWCWLRRGRLRLAGDRRLAAYGRQRLSARSRQRLTCFGFGDDLLRRLARYGRLLCRRRSRRWLTDDRRLAICRWCPGGLRRTGRRSGWRISILNRDRLWSDRWR